MVSSTTRGLITGKYEYFGRKERKRRKKKLPSGQIVNQAAHGKRARRGEKKACFE
jgi:hypothetical protein